MNSDLLKNRTIIITGGSSGIGKALALGLSKLGAAIGVASRSEDKLQSIVKEIQENGGVAHYAVMDVQNYENIEAAFNLLIEKLGKVDVLINNAGINRMKYLTKWRIQNIDLLVDTNIKGVIYCTRAMLPHMYENKGGAIIQTSSVAAEQLAKKMAIYSATKAAINAFTLSMAEETKRNKVTFNAILPSFVDTPLMHQGLTQEQVDMLNPLPPEKLVPYYAYVASSKAKRFTGNLVRVPDVERALALHEQVPEEETPSWSSIKSLVEDNFGKTAYKQLKSIRKLLDFLLQESH